MSKEHINKHLRLKNVRTNNSAQLNGISDHGYLFKNHYNENMKLNRLMME